MERLLRILTLLCLVTLFAPTVRAESTSLNKPFICIRSLIEKRIGGRVGIDFAVDLTKQIMRSSYSESEIKKVTIQCQNFVDQNITDVTMTPEVAQSYLELVSNTEPMAVYDFIDGLLNQTLNCKVGVIGAKGALVGGLEPGIGINYCISTAARKHIGLNLSVAHSIDLQAGLNIFGRIFSTQAENAIITSYTASRKHTALYVGVYTDGNKDILQGDIEGFSIGLNFAVGLGNSEENGGMIKLLPLGTSTQWINHVLNRTIPPADDDDLDQLKSEPQILN